MYRNTKYITRGNINEVTGAYDMKDYSDLFTMPTRLDFSIYPLSQAAFVARSVKAFPWLSARAAATSSYVRRNQQQPLLIQKLLEEIVSEIKAAPQKERNAFSEMRSTPRFHYAIDQNIPGFILCSKQNCFAIVATPVTPSSGESVCCSNEQHLSFAWYFS